MNTHGAWRWRISLISWVTTNFWWLIIYHQAVGSCRRVKEAFINIGLFLGKSIDGQGATTDVKLTYSFAPIKCYVFNSVRIAYTQLFWVTLFHYRRESVWRNIVYQLGCQRIDNFVCVLGEWGSYTSGKIIRKNIILMELPEIWVSRQGFMWEHLGNRCFVPKLFKIQNTYE